jgi:hypothetical protein
MNKTTSQQTNRLVSQSTSLLASEFSYQSINEGWAGVFCGSCACKCGLQFLTYYFEIFDLRNTRDNIPINLLHNEDLENVVPTNVVRIVHRRRSCR